LRALTLYGFLPNWLQSAGPASRKSIRPRLIASEAGAASTGTSRLALRRHSLVLGRVFGIPILCGVGGVRSDGQARRGDPASWPTRPQRRAWSGGSGTPLATAQADRGANRRFSSRPPDLGNAPPPLSRPGDVLCLLRAARAVTAKPALVPVGRRNSPASGPRGRRLMCLRGGRHPRPVERHHEQARMVERVNHPASQGQNTHRLTRGRRTARRFSASLSSSDLSLAMGPSVTSDQRRSRPAGVAHPLLHAPPRRGLDRVLVRRSAAPVWSAIRVPACTWHMPSGRPSRAVSALGSNGWRRLPSRVLQLPPRHEEAERLTLRSRCLCVRMANAYRTGRAFVTLPPLVSPPARKREDAGASPGSLSYPQTSSRNAKRPLSAAERDRGYGE
jgi:hypothetical protein